MIWYEKSDIVRHKPNGICVTLRDNDGKFIDKVNIPTNYYPLCDGEKAEIFTSANTVEVTDKSILDIFDKASYKIGHCYQNTDGLIRIAEKAGIHIVPYVGWLFVENNTYPIHHCWAVIKVNEKSSILDLADDFSLMFGGQNGANFVNAQADGVDVVDILVEFRKWACKLRNSQRCMPVGKATEILMYVGCPCSPENGRTIYRNLLIKFPNHLVERNCDKRGLNKTQARMVQEGLLQL